jgi:hypothetical protein
LEHGLDLRPLQTKRTAKRDRPTEECEAVVEAVLSSDGGNGAAERSAPLRLVPSPDAGRKSVTTDPELKRMLDELRWRLPVGRDRGGLDSGGKDAA